MRIAITLQLTFKTAAPDGRHPFHLDLPPGATVEQAVSRLPIPPAAPRIILVNGRYTTGEQTLQDGDRLTIFPPLEGG